MYMFLTTPTLKIRIKKPISLLKKKKNLFRSSLLMTTQKNLIQSGPPKFEHVSHQISRLFSFLKKKKNPKK
jgi:hypothetical protein